MRRPVAVAGRVLNDVGLAAWLAAAAGEDDRWPAWTWPVALAHTAGAALVTIDNAGRLGAQRGVASVAAAKAVLTAGALGVTAWGTLRAPGDAAPRRIVAALTGVTTALNAVLGEQQRPATVARGIARRLAAVAR